MKKRKAAPKKGPDLSMIDPNAITGIIGLDVSQTATGLARYDFQTFRLSTRCIETDSAQTDLQRYLTQVEAVLPALLRTDLLIVEGYAMAGSGHLVQLAGQGEILKYLAWQKTGVEAISVAPVQIKKFLCGKTSLPKEDVKLWGFKLFGQEYPTTHEIEARVLVEIGIGMFFSHLTPNGKRHAYQNEVIETLKQRHGLA